MIYANRVSPLDFEEKGRNFREKEGLFSEAYFK